MIGPIMICRRCRQFMFALSGFDSDEGFYEMWQCLCGERIDDVILINRNRAPIRDPENRQPRLKISMIPLRK